MTNKKLSANKKDCEMPRCVEEKDKQAISKSFEQMNAIARGVEVRLDLLTGHLKKVTQESTDIARRLGIREKEIQRWIAVKTMHDCERNKVIKRLLNRSK